MPPIAGAARRALAVSLLVPVVVAACSTSGSPTPSSASPSPTAAPGASATPAPSQAAAAVLLEVRSEGGFINPSASLAALPTVVVYADGRILAPAAPPPDGGSPLVQPISVVDVGSTGAAAIAAAIRASGLDQPQVGDPGVVADSGTTVFTAFVNGAPVTSHFAASGPGGPGVPGLPGAGGGNNPERTAAFSLLGRLLDPGETWGTAAPQTSTYVPSGYRIFAAPGAPASDATTAVPSVAWPLATGLASFGTPAVPDRGVTGLRSGVVLGADAQLLAPLLASATTATPFTSGGASFTLWVRALLPHELPG